MRRWKKTAAALFVGVLLTTAVPAPAAAATVTEKLLYGAAAMLYVSKYYSELDDRGQSQFLGECQQQTGVYENGEADGRVQGIYSPSPSAARAPDATAAPTTAARWRGDRKSVV